MRWACATVTVLGHQPAPAFRRHLAEASYRRVFVSLVASSLTAGLVSRHHAVLMIWAAGGR